MDTFKYTALSKDGNKVSGVIEGVNQMDAVARIKENYPIVIQIAPEEEKNRASSFLAADIYHSDLYNPRMHNFVFHPKNHG